MWRLLLAVLLAVGLVSPAQAKSYYLNRADVIAQVRADGSMHVQETREVVFEGTFHAFDRTIPVPPGAEITNITVSEGGIPYQERSGEEPGTFTSMRSARDLSLSWFYVATDETRTFALEYDVLGAVQRHADVAELYWQFIEPDHEWEAKTSTVTILFPVPVPASQIKAWAHGPLQGNVAIGSDRVQLTCNPLPPNTMVEGRVLLPAGVITSSPRSDYSGALPSIQEEEAGWAGEANQQRRLARASIFLPFGTLGVGFLVAFALYWRYGREYLEPNPPIYEREPLEGWKPNEAAYLWHWGSLGPNDMTAMLMDLVRRGALQLVIRKEDHAILGGLLGSREKEEQYLRRVPEFKGELSRAEQHLIERVLFAGIDSDVEVSMSEFTERAKADPIAAKARYDHWKKAAEDESEKVTIVAPDSNVAMGFGIGIGVLVFLSTFLFASVLQSPAAIVDGFGGFGIIIASLNTRRRTREAASALHHWQAFRRYLLDFSRLREYPAPAVVLWEQYLVFAITLGVADRVIEQFKDLYVRLPDAERSTFVGFPNWVSSEGQGFSSLGSISSAFDSFSHTFTAATSSFSSSSGSGGGFSGGGGGGGGGGSSGAR